MRLARICTSRTISSKPSASAQSRPGELGRPVSSPMEFPTICALWWSARVCLRCLWKSSWMERGYEAVQQETGLRVGGVCELLGRAGDHGVEEVRPGDAVGRLDEGPGRGTASVLEAHADPARALVSRRDLSGEEQHESSLHQQQKLFTRSRTAAGIRERRSYSGWASAFLSSRTAWCCSWRNLPNLARSRCFHFSMKGWVWLD